MCVVLLTVFILFGGSTQNVLEAEYAATLNPPPPTERFPERENIREEIRKREAEGMHARVELDSDVRTYEDSNRHPSLECLLESNK